jgi:hypothetical protein
MNELVVLSGYKAQKPVRDADVCPVGVMQFVNSVTDKWVPKESWSFKEAVEEGASVVAHRVDWSTWFIILTADDPSQCSPTRAIIHAPRSDSSPFSPSQEHLQGWKELQQECKHLTDVLAAGKPAEAAWDRVYKCHVPDVTLLRDFARQYPEVKHVLLHSFVASDPYAAS